MSKSNRFGGDTPADIVTILTNRNPTWNLGAHREGWEMLNWRESSSMPGSMDYTASQRGYMVALETIWDGRRDQGQKIGAGMDSLLDEWLSQNYHPHPDLERYRSLSFRLINFQEATDDSVLGIYILEVPTVLKLGKIPTDHPEFAKIEDRLIQEQVLSENIDCLMELAQFKKEKKGIGLYLQIQSGEPLLFSVRYKQGKKS